MKRVPTVPVYPFILRQVPLLMILAIAVWLRFDRLTTVPPSLSHDEAAIAYNAYSVFRTGKDEYGVPFPLLFRSFDDYKLPGMVYATIPFVALFGKSELAARLPSALFGILSVVIMYGIAIELLGNRRRLTVGPLSLDTALLPAFVLAVQPWHINFSRQLFESNGAVCFFMAGTYYLLRSRRQYRDIFPAGLLYVAALYFYYSVRLVIPFVAVVYFLCEKRTIMKHMKTTLMVLAICTTAFLPMAVNMLSPGGMERISMVSVVNDPEYLRLRDAYVLKSGTHPKLLDKIIYNRRLALARTVLGNYAKNISWHNLFVTGTGTYGALYPIDAILVPIGIFLLTGFSPLAAGVVLMWLCTAFLPGALSINQPNTLRTLIAAPAFALLSGLGLVRLITWLLAEKKNAVLSFFAMMVLITSAAVEFPRFQTAYFTDNPSNNAIAFGDGNKQMVSYVLSHESLYDRVYVSGYYWRPYIYMLYWGRTDPASYQRGGTRDHFGKYYFTSARWDTSGIKFTDPSFDPNILPGDGKTLYILSPEELEAQNKHFMKIDTINGRRTDNVFVASSQQ